MAGLQPINVVALDGYDISTTGFETEYFCVYDSELLGIQVYVSEGVAPTGIFNLEISNELYFPVQFGIAAGEGICINDNSLVIWDLSNMSYNWVRLIYQRVSGTGKATVIFNKKVRY